MSETLTGIGVGGGSVAGPVARMAPPPRIPDELESSGDPDAELVASAEALDAVADGLDAQAAQGGSAGDILSAQALMVRDPSLRSAVEERTREGRPAAHAVAAAMATFRDRLAAAGPYIAGRAADLDDLRDRTVARLLGQPMPGPPAPGNPYVLVAGELAPADTAALDTDSVLAIVTERGGPTTHAAILAKSLGLPAVVACPDAGGLRDGDRVLVDGAVGSVVTGPDLETVARAEARNDARKAAQAEVSGPGRTADGYPVQLLVNVGAAGEFEQAASEDSEGVGLLRTEFLFLDRTSAPSLEEQAESYERAFRAFAGRKVVVRTLDAGADKPLPFAGQHDEPNPALGMRGLRTARQLPGLLDTQLRALGQAAANADAEVWVMAPMVSTPAEAAGFADQVHSCGITRAGAMVEIPAAALRAKEMLDSCDFLSVGTNDLAQYTFAADRMAGGLAELLDPWQPALLDLVRLTATAGAEARKPVGVCGEAAADPLLACVLAGLGASSLSVAPAALPAVRSALARQTRAHCQRLAELAREASDAVEARTACVTECACRRW